MRSCSAVGLAILFSVEAAAQRRAPAPAIPPVRVAPVASAPSSAGALGGSFASVGMSRPLGGIAPPSALALPPRNRATVSGYRYVGPVYYVPNSYDATSSWQASGSSIFNQPANPALYYLPAPAQPSQQPIVINQYFGSRSGSKRTETAGRSAATTETAETTPGDLLGTPQKYYLITYKDHTVYSALTYWLEGDTLHYVTTQNTHNQASLSLIDVDQTTKLNAGNSVPFSLK